MRLEIRDIYKSFKGIEVLHGISFNIESGKALGLLGRNGAGKTTTIRIIMNLFDMDKGEILLDGKKFNPRKYQIGYLPEERGLYPKKKVLEQLVYLGQLRGLDKKTSRENSLYWLDRLGVEEYKDKKLETLSKGNQQKVQLAEAFLCNPEIVILDEPFSGLDPVNSHILKDIILELIDNEKLLIFSSHQMSYVEEFCEEVALIDKGNIVLTGNLDDIKREYGMNRLTLSGANLSIRELEKVLVDGLKDIVRIIELKRDYIIIELIEGKTKSQLLKEIVEMDLDIESFSVYKPSLAGAIQFGLIILTGVIVYNLNAAAWNNNLDFIFKIPGNVLMTFSIFGILGYLFYSFMYGALGALVSRTEDISTSSTPITIVFVMVFMISIIGMQNTEGIILKIASFVPLSSFMAMFVRVSMGTVTNFEVIISLAILAVSTALIGFIASKIYRMGTLMYGNPVKLKDAIKILRSE